MHIGYAKVMHYAICIMRSITWEHRRDPTKSMHYETYAFISTRQLAASKVPAVENEPMHATGQFVNDLDIRSKQSKLARQTIPSDHARHLCTYHEADGSTVATVIDGALSFSRLSGRPCLGVFLRVAELVSGQYHFKLVTATMLGQGKNAWQAEIDAATELSDFLRLGVKSDEEL
ncbi:hypothetical protein DEU56DRAFT_899691 [Suillus clintonianus]|uniref:uncharacterized protein n=1 Tax=Suillus clintonianus TaxID=1904413 RepID=UPI001B869C69|nr:uncharacterized protein DEU56DRAFT_899691 [Suillus clintonianus]KAG2146220.1 hypothetical protein DEU56DRAFT_899691 [Suillus clintonianus]